MFCKFKVRPATEEAFVRNQSINKSSLTAFDPEKAGFQKNAYELFFINFRRGCRINGDWFPKQVHSRGVQGRVPLGNVRDFLIPQDPFFEFWVILKYLTDFRKTVETGLNPRLNFASAQILRVRVNSLGPLLSNAISAAINSPQFAFIFSVRLLMFLFRKS